VQNVSKDLLALFAGREGHFKLESGHHGNLWLDLDHLFLRPQKLQPFIAELAQRLAKFEVKGVCGPLLGGALLAQVIAIELNIEFYYTERFVNPQADGLYSVEYRLPKPLQEAIRGKRRV